MSMWHDFADKARAIADEIERGLALRDNNEPKEDRSNNGHAVQPNRYKGSK